MAYERLGDRVTLELTAVDIPRVPTTTRDGETISCGGFEAQLPFRPKKPKLVFTVFHGDAVQISLQFRYRQKIIAEGYLQLSDNTSKKTDRFDVLEIIPEQDRVTER